MGWSSLNEDADEARQEGLDKLAENARSDDDSSDDSGDDESEADDQDDDD